jgi:hypothetical protein
MNIPLTLTTPTTRPAWLPWMLLPARTLLFAGFQVVFALGFYLAGSAAGWDASAAWWPFTVTFTNLVCVALLVRLLRSEGKSYLSLFRFERAYLKSDLLALGVILVISGPIAFLPNILLAQWLFGDSTTALSLFIRHLPLWAAVAGFIFFPLTQGLAELVTYFLYIQPRLEQQTGSRWLSVSLASVALGVQHVAVPLVFDGRFIAWRMLMFIPFAFLVGIVLRWRPRLLPYLAIIHVLMDMATAAMLFAA